MVLRSSQQGLQANRSAIAALQTQMSTGLRISTSSDDPTAVSQVMGSSSTLLAVDQYKRNIDTANSRNTAEGGSLDRLTDILSRAKELATSVATATVTPAARQTAAIEMESLFNSAVALSNSKFADEYLFGGDNVTQNPFTTTGTGASLDFTSSNPVGTRTTAVSAGQSLVATHDGDQVFASSGVLTSLRDATIALASGTQSAIANGMPALDAAFANVQNLTGESGARANALDIASQNLDALKANLTAYRSTLQDVDIESAVVELVSKQTTYQAAMMATSKVLGMTLTDYLR